MTLTAAAPPPASLPAPAGPRSYLMCPPTHFAVDYAINAWMDVTVPVDVGRATDQWRTLVATYQRLGHRVHVLDPVPGLPDMVYAANGAFSVGGVAYGARFRHQQRADEAERHRDWYAAHRLRHVPAARTNEGEGDFAYVPGAADEADGLVLAGHGFRTELAAHAEVAAVLGRRVVGLQLVDPRFYHLDTALFVLDAETVCYFPGAFSASARRTLATLFPGAVLATEADAVAFGLNAVSDGTHVVLPAGAHRLATALADRGFVPVPVDMDELHKGGGSVKCCTAELRG